MENSFLNKYILSIKSKPTWENIDAYDEKFFSDVESENNSLNWDQAHHVYRRRLTAIFSLSAYTLMTYFLSVDFVPLLSWEYLFSSLFAVFIGYSTWDHLAGFYFRYRFGEDAICVRRSENRPAVIYKIVRGVAWFGVAFCIVMGIVFGPMIFVGAGGFALMAFRLIDAKDVVLINRIPYSSILFMQVTEEDKELSLLFRDAISGIEDNNELLFMEKFTVETFYYSDNDIESVIAWIKKKAGYDIELIRTKKRKDQINLFEKARALGLSLQKVRFDIDSLKEESHT